MAEKEKNKEIPYAEEFDGIDLSGLFRKLIKEYKLILKWCGVAAVLAIIVGFSIPKEYSVISKMTLESDTVGSSSSGTLGTLASMAGINLGSMGGATDIMSPELYPEILSSTPFVLELFPTQVQFKDKKGEHAITYYEYVRKYIRKPWWNAVINFPGQALGWFTGLFRRKDPNDVAKNTEDTLDFEKIDPSKLTMGQMGAGGEMRRRVSWSVDKKSSILCLTVKEQNPDVATQISASVIELLQKYLVDYRTEKARRDLAYYEQLYDEAKVEYYEAQQRYATFLDRNQSVITQRGRADQDRLKNEMTLAYSLYNSCAQQVQAAKAKVQLDTPVFNVIDPPQYPYRGKPSKVVLLVAFVFLGAIFASLWVLWGRNAWAELVRKDEDAEA